jgi:formyl-CoA transferase
VIPPLRWPEFCNFLGRPEYGSDPRFVTNDARMANHEAVVAFVEDWLQRQTGRESILAQFETARFAIGPVLSVPDAMRHPHFQERRIVRTVQDRCFGSIEIPGMPLRFSAFPDELSLEAPYLGEHNRELLTDLLGLDETEIEGLEAAQVLQAKVPEIAMD